MGNIWKFQLKLNTQNIFYLLHISCLLKINTVSVFFIFSSSIPIPFYLTRLPVPRALKPLICFIGKMSYLAGGMAISIRGRQASRQEAPILVVAPHSSFLDSCIVYATKMSSVIVRKESMDNYVGSMFLSVISFWCWVDKCVVFGVGLTSVSYFWFLTLGVLFWYGKYGCWLSFYKILLLGC